MRQSSTLVATMAPNFTGDSRVDRRTAVAPGPGLLQLAGEADQDVLAPPGRDELHADRELRGAPVQRQRDRRLAGQVLDRSEWNERQELVPRGEWVVGRGSECAERERRRGERGRQQEVEARGVELAERARDHVAPLDGRQEVERRDLL